MGKDQSLVWTKRSHEPRDDAQPASAKPSQLRVFVALHRERRRSARISQAVADPRFICIASPTTQASSMVGPTKWSGAKKRAKRPQTEEAKRSLQQDVGRLKRVQMKKPVIAPQAVVPAAKRSAKELQRDEKRIRALNKLLRQIEDLQQREAAGETLDEQQEVKLGRLDGVLAEMEELMSGGAS